MIFEKFFRQLSLLPVDLKNLRNFKTEMSAELSDPASKINEMQLTFDKDFMHVSTVVTVPDEFQKSGTDADIMAKLRETVKPMTNYLCFELGWAEMLSVPQFFYLDDPSDPGASRTYLVVWNYMPLVMDEKSFWIKAASFFAGILCVLGAAAWAITVIV